MSDGSHGTSAAFLRKTAVAALIAANTLAQTRIESARTWPTQSGAMPAIIVYDFDSNGEDQSGGGTAPFFEVTLSLTVDCRVEHASKRTAEAALDLLCAQVKLILLTPPTLIQHVNKIKSVRLAKTYAPEEAGGKNTEKHVFIGRFVLELVYFQVWEPTFATGLSGVNYYLDALNVVDPTGIYVPPFAYTPTPEPRTVGPDGRVEIAAKIDLPQ